MNITNVHGLPDALVNAVKNDPYTGGGDISVTKLIDSPRKRVLGKRFKDLVTVDVSEMLWAVMGQATHTFLERAETTAMVEQRLYAEVDGWKVSGQFDRAEIKDGVMQDWKVCSAYKAGGDIAWERQLNCLRWLAHKNGIQIDRLEVAAIFRDWKKSEALRRADYPQQPIAVIPVPVWSLEDAEAYVRTRVGQHQAAENKELPECTDEERWYSGTTFALLRPGLKRAKKVAPTREELGEIPPDHIVEERPGINRRCENGYCDVAPFCEQYQRIKQAQGEPTNDVDF